MKISTQVIIGFAFTLVVITIITSTFYVEKNRFENNIRWVIHTNEVLKSSAQLQKIVADAETGFRGYLLSGKKEFLKPYDNGINFFQEEFDIVYNLVSDNPLQQKNLDRIKIKFSDWNNHIAKPLIMAKERSLYADSSRLIYNKLFEERILSGVDNNRMNILRNEFERFDDIEFELEKERDDTFDASLIEINGLFIVLMLLSYIFILFLYIVIFKSFTSRINKLVKLSENLAEGKFDLGTTFEKKDELKPLEESLKLSAVRLKEAFTKISASNHALEESERRYRQIVEKANDIIYRSDYQGNFIYVNPVAETKTGYTESELLMMNFTDLVDSSMMEEVKSFYQDQFSKKIPSSYKEFLIVTKSGDKIWLGQNVEIIFSDQHKVNGFSAVVREITLRKKMEAQMLQAQKQAEQAVLIKEQFLANMSHEIRTPMNSIIGFTDLLLKTKMDEEQKDFLHAIKHSGENLLYLINDILDFSKISANKITFEQVGFNISNILDQAENLFLPRTKEKKSQMIIQLDKSVPLLLFGDPYRLNQILLNLISNAIKFTEKGQVTVKVGTEELEKDHVVLSVEVSDTGIGIPKEKMNDIFQSFTQASNETTRKFGGTGLGLSIVKNLVELQGGKISVESEEGKGSSFKVSIPYKRYGDNKQLLKVVEKKEEFTFKGIVKILLAEDNELNQRLAKKVLSDFNFKVEIAANGIEVLEKLENNNFDLILMDIQMPDMDGYATTRMIREKFPESKRNIPIIAMTAHAMSGEIKKCIDAGMNEYISKPFKADDLFNKIAMLLDEKSGQDSSSVKVSEQDSGLLVDLSYLRDLSDNNEYFINEMVHTFLEQLNDFIPQMDLYLNNKDWHKLEGVAHSLKSSVTILKINLLIDPVTKMEKAAGNEKEVYKIPALLESIKTTAKNVIKELEDELSHLDNN